MNTYGPGDKNPEEIANDIMNQSDEGVSDLLENTEVYDPDDEFESEEPSGSDESDDGGDYSE